MTFSAGPLVVPGINATTFHPAGTWLASGQRIFSSNDVFFDLPGVQGHNDVVAILFHPVRPLIARLMRVGDVELIELESKQHTSIKTENMARIAISASGDLLALGGWSGDRVHIYGLDGKEQQVLSIPAATLRNPPQPPALSFAESDSVVIAFTGHDTRVRLPLDGSPSTTLQLPKLKGVSEHSGWRSIWLPSGLFLHDFNAWRLVSHDGELLSGAKGQFDAVCAVPGSGLIARLKLSKKSIDLLDPVTAESVATLKAKGASWNEGLACSPTLVSYATKSALELLELPSDVAGRR